MVVCRLRGSARRHRSGVAADPAVDLTRAAGGLSARVASECGSRWGAGIGPLARFALSPLVGESWRGGDHERWRLWLSPPPHPPPQRGGGGTVPASKASAPTNKKNPPLPPLPPAPRPP